MSEDKKRKNSALSPAANVLQSLLQSSKSPLADQFTRWRLWQDWERVVGPEIAKHSMPVGFLNGTLYVWVQSAVRLQEMTFLVRPLREKINAYVGYNWLRYIRFTLDKKSVPQAAGADESLKSFIKGERQGPEIE
jgi:predicted nucleic acid-binding Zn ribbon protein